MTYYVLPAEGDAIFLIATTLDDAIDEAKWLDIPDQTVDIHDIDDQIVASCVDLEV